MKHTFIAVFVAFSLLAAPVAAQAASSSSTGPSRYFVPTTKSFWKNAFGVRHSYDNGFTTNLSDLQLRLAKFAGLKPIAVKSFNILADAAVASPTASVSEDPTPEPTPAASIGWGEKLMLGKDAGTSGGAGVSIAVLDTGADMTHPDLQNRIVVCSDFADTQSFIKDECTDNNGHGTHVAGILAADGGPDGLGMIGMAPTASISIFKVCNDEGLCMGDDIGNAITVAVDTGANIIVLGMGGENQSGFIDTALQYATDHNVLVVAAAGNDGPYTNSMDWPARDARVVSVGAIDAEGTVADFSSRGNNLATKAYKSNDSDLEFAAPGVNIESTFPGDTYAILSGTSMAAPAVAGLAARIWQFDAKNPASATRTMLHELAHDIAPAGDDNSSGWGIPLLK